MNQKKDALEIFFNEEARLLLFDLVDRASPSPSYDPKDDIFEPTISAVFLLFHDLMIKNTPALYKSEWFRIANAIKNTNFHEKKFRLPRSSDEAKFNIVASLEETYSLNGEIENFELSKKLAELSSIEICSIRYHVQKFHVKERRGEKYVFPEISFGA